MTTRRQLMFAAAATAALALPLAAAPAARAQDEPAPRDPEGVENWLLGYFAQNHDIEIHEVTRDSRLLDDLGLDELAIVHTLMFVEETWAIEIPDEDAVKLLTFGDLVDYIVGD